MSYWMHISGHASVNDPFRTKKKGAIYYALLKCLGKPVNVDDVSSFDRCKLPWGSEGSMQYNIKINELPNSTAYEVEFGGALRDVETIDEFDKWFRNFVAYEFEVKTQKGKEKTSFSFSEINFEVEITNGSKWIYTVNLEDEATKYTVVATEIKR